MPDVSNEPERLVVAVGPALIAAGEITGRPLDLQKFKRDGKCSKLGGGIARGLPKGCLKS